MIYGYCRCSTNEQLQDISRQINELKKMGVEEDNIYTEYLSGSCTKKKELNRLLDKVVEGDTIMATEVSRVTRSTRQLCDLIDLAKEKKIKFKFGYFEVDFTGEKIDPMLEGMLKLMGVFAEIERNMISERVKSGMANAKGKGVKIGRPRLSLDTLPNKFIQLYPLYANKTMNITDLSKIVGKSRGMIYTYIERYEEALKEQAEQAM